MRGICFGFMVGFVLVGTVQAQKRGGAGGAGRLPIIEQEQPDSLAPLTAQDSAIFRARMTAAEKPYSDCKAQAFQTCASGELEARLSSDGTAYGVLFTRNYDGRSLYVAQITRRAGGGGGGGRGGRGGGGRAKKRG